MLELLDHLPPRFLSCQSHELHQILAGPTLIDLPGLNPQPLFVSTLLHGNEPTGFEAIKEILRPNAPLPRRLLIFIGNIEAARHHVRHLDHQPDYNRIWEEGESPEHKLAEQVLDVVMTHQPLACVDIHNNTGRNPFYSCFNRKCPTHLALANHFGQTIVYFEDPANALTVRFAREIPATIIECGQAQHPESGQYAVAGLNKILKSPNAAAWSVDHDLHHYYEVIGKILIPPATHFAFGGEFPPTLEEDSPELIFAANFDESNFHCLNEGHPFAHTHPQLKTPLEHLKIHNRTGDDIAGQFLRPQTDHTLRVQRAFVPSMLTLEQKIIRQDCLGYAMIQRSVKDLCLKESTQTSPQQEPL